MTNEEMRVAIAEAMGYKICKNSKCEWKKTTHVHKGDDVFFPGSDETRRFPDYPNDLNAMAEAEETLNDKQYQRYRDLLQMMAFEWACEHRPEWKYFRRESCTAAQRAEAFLRTLGRWLDK